MAEVRGSGREQAELAEGRIRAMSDEELLRLVEPVRLVSPDRWREDQLRADMELDYRLGVRGETLVEAARHPPRTVPVSLRMAVELLERVRAEAERRRTPYQLLIRDLIEAGLAAGRRRGRPTRRRAST